MPLPLSEIDDLVSLLQAALPSAPTPRELLAYAACLVRHGFLAEGARILGDLDAKRDPDVLFHRATICLARHDHRAARYLLERYLASPELPFRARLAAETRLAAGLVFEDRADEAEPLLGRLIDEARMGGFTQVLNRLAELSLENLLARRKFYEARRFLETSAGIGSFLVERFGATIDYLSEPHARDRAKRLLEIRETARAHADFEAVRECDLTIAIHARDLSLFQRVYFGTPFAAYRARALQRFGVSERALSNRYVVTPKAKPLVVTVDLATGECSRGGEPLEAGSLPLQLLSTLASDLYRPLNLGTLFTALYPEENFTLGESAMRVEAVAHRLGDWLTEVGIGGRIEIHDGAYRLELPEGTGLILDRLAPIPVTEVLKIEPLRKTFHGRQFSVPEAAMALGLPLGKVSQVLTTACENRALVRTGTGKSARYQFAE